MTTKQEAELAESENSTGAHSPSQPHYGPKSVNFLIPEMALVTKVGTDDVWTWLAAGWADFKANTLVSVS